MKTLKLIALGIVLFLGSMVQAQVTVTFNLGSPPQWGPAGYSDVRYYYLPDIESYYDVQLSQFIYFNGVAWVHRAYLPTRYRDYDLYKGYKVVMNDYRGNTPYNHFRDHKSKYTRGYHGDAQRTIGNRPDSDNYNNRKHSNGKPNRNSTPGNRRNYGNGNDKGSKMGHDQNRGNKKGR